MGESSNFMIPKKQQYVQRYLLGAAIVTGAVVLQFLGNQSLLLRLVLPLALLRMVLDRSFVSLDSEAKNDKWLFVIGSIWLLIMVMGVFLELFGGRFSETFWVLSSWASISGFIGRLFILERKVCLPQGTSLSSD